MDNPNIQKQYNKWVYPKPIEDLVAWKKEGSYQLSDPSLVFYHLFPERVKSPLKILVAGCGTHQSACLAFKPRKFRYGH